MAPLIITLRIDAASHAYFTQLRNEHFPKHCNYLEAHLTLFHHLPADETFIKNSLQELAGKTSAFDLEVSAVKNIGNGVAFAVESKELMKLHKQIQNLFKPYLIPQDAQKLWPHITIQNKVTAFKAKQTAELLQQSFTPSTIQATGFDSWLYLKGPWEFVESFKFT